MKYAVLTINKYRDNGFNIQYILAEKNKRLLEKSAKNIKRYINECESLVLYTDYYDSKTIDSKLLYYYNMPFEV